ncbi:MAG: PorP/SprF family type IX secretion system membrane protein [Bacteroidota bacterium]
MRKRLIILSFVLFLLFGEGWKGAFAQQVGMYNHSFYKPLVFNPAFTGTDDAANAMLISRSQWTGFKGAPQLTIFTADGSLMDKKVGVGLGLISDRKGLMSRMGGNMYYSYHLKLNEDMRLSLGASFGIIDQTIDFSRAQVENAADPTLYTDYQHKTTFDVNAGLVFSWKDLNIGVSAPQLIETKVKSVDYADSSDAKAYYSQKRHYMASVNYKFVIIEDKDISIKPFAQVRIVPQAPLQYDVAVNLDWQDKGWVGATYKSNYAVAANIGFCVHKQLYLGYSYDFIIGSIGKYAGVSHEIMVNFKILGRKSASVSTNAPVDTLPEMENTAYEQRFDKLENQLKKNQEKLKELNDKLDKQNTTQAIAPVQNTKPGTEDSEGIFITKRSDFKNNKDIMPDKGFYVIVGIFFYRDFAIDEVKNYNKRGFANANWIYSQSKQNNYVFAEKLETKEEALEKAKELNSKDSSNAWVLKLIE